MYTLIYIFESTIHPLLEIIQRENVYQKKKKKKKKIEKKTEEPINDVGDEHGEYWTNGRNKNANLLCIYI